MLNSGIWIIENCQYRFMFFNILIIYYINALVSFFTIQGGRTLAELSEALAELPFVRGIYLLSIKYRKELY